MNELDNVQGALCDRCDDVLGLHRFVVKVDSEPSVADPIEVLICERCMDSLSRWMQRRKEGRHSGPRGARSDASPAGSKRSGRPNRFADVLDREESRVRRNRRLLVGGTLLIFAVMLGLLYSTVISDVLRNFRQQKPFGTPVAPR